MVAVGVLVGVLVGPEGVSVAEGGVGVGVFVALIACRVAET